MSTKRGAIHKYSKRLRANLHKNALRSKNEIERRYKPWFETDCPVKGYWFCTSGVLTPGAQSDLRQTIEDFFADMARECAPLQHLANVNIQVLGWNDFDGALRANPSLEFHWFQNLPPGFQPLRSISSGKTFRKFLQTGELKFFSRSEFNRELKTDQKDCITDERSILSGLLERDEKLGLVLSGPGGVGKTRLALELGLEAEEEGWLVLQVERSAIPEEIERLAQMHTSAANVLLVIDYAEAARSLSDLAQRMEYANRIGAHRFRFVATCRASALGAVKEAIEDHAFEVIEFSNASGGRYENWVVGKILASTNLPNAELIGPVCSGLPVLAAFAVYLFKEHRDDFKAQFGQIHHGDDFRKWADKRLRLAIRAQGLVDTSMRKRLAEIAASLPLSEEEYDDLYESTNETQRLCDLLMADRWIERDHEGVAAAHDIFADAILMHFLFETIGAETDRTASLLCNAANAGTFDRSLIALNRLAAHPNFNDIDGFVAIQRAYRRNPAPVVAASDLLLKTRLPDEKTAVRVLNAIPEVASEIAKNAACDVLISLLAEATAASKDSAWLEEATRILHPFLDRAVQRTNNSNIVVRRALRLHPERYREQASEWIRSEPNRSETHFLFVAWLRSDLPLEDISSDIDFWLFNGGETDLKASFVFAAWLDRAAKLNGADCATQIAKISEHLAAWLKIYASDPNARFVYLSWLRAASEIKGDDCNAEFTKIIGFLLKWLDASGTSLNAGAIYEILLEAIAKLDRKEIPAQLIKISAYLNQWLASHGSVDRVEFVYKNWLEITAQLDRKYRAAHMNMIEPSFKAWLEANATDENSRYAFQAWLDAAAELHRTECCARMDAIKALLLAWLEFYGSEDFARFVYEPWLNAATKLDRNACIVQMQAVEILLLKWIEIYGNDECARFVYQPWLDAAANLYRYDCSTKAAKIERQVLAWCSINAESENADHVYTSWLSAAKKLSNRDCTNQIAKISSHLGKWLEVHGVEDRADFLFKELLSTAAQLGRNECAAIVTEVETALFEWLRRYATTRKAGYVYAPWLNAVAKLDKEVCAIQIEKISAPLFSWLREIQTGRDASFVFKAWLEAAARLDREDCAYQMVGVESAFFAWLNANSAHEDTGYVIGAWLDASAKINKDDCVHKVSKIQPYVEDWLDKNSSCEEANFIYKAWLNAAANQDRRNCFSHITYVETPVIKWLSIHGTCGGASFVYRAWLNAAAKLHGNECQTLVEKVEPFLMNWIDEHGTASDAGFVYAPWLSAAARLDPRSCSAKIDKISNYIVRWLHSFGTEKKAGFVYERWLNAVAKLDRKGRDGQMSMMSVALTKWFDENGAKHWAQYVERAWTRAGGSPAAIRNRFTRVRGHAD